ncbi:MAG: TIGR03087 family PEP-CTERM/XrtA system glycosyltransferase [Gammaproteobacteria bacterium]
MSHRLPYPPNKGDKIRSFHLLRHLSKRYRVHLGTFVDDPADWRYVDEVRKLCDEVCIHSLKPWWATLRSVSGLATNEALTVQYYRHRQLQRWVDRLLGRGTVRRAVVFSSSMARYLRGGLADGMRGVIDFVDVDSDKWAQYATRAPWPLSWVYRREAERLLCHDASAALAFDASLFVSREEAALFQHLVPAAAMRTTYVENGVDADYFSPARPYTSPFPADCLPVVFTGAMDYRANVDAVEWFAEEVFPMVVERFANAAFFIVGARPNERVRRLQRLGAVTVTGGVPDIRPYLAHARVAVAPLRIARGIQNKVLEALAMAVPVVATPAAAEGIDQGAGPALQIEEEPADFAAKVARFLSGSIPREVGTAARNWVVQRYNWDDRLEAVDRLLESSGEMTVGQPAGEEPLDGICQR